MERRTGARAHVDFPLSAFLDGVRHECRAIELSPRGMVIEWPQSFSDRAATPIGAFELHVTGVRPIRLRARTVWGRQRLQGLRFVWIHDTDRLAIAELLDDLVRIGEPLH